MVDPHRDGTPGPPAERRPVGAGRSRRRPVVDLADPVSVLRRIAYLLERQQADTYRVRAYRRAAEAVAAIESGELLALHRRHGLQDLAGVGDKTAAVVSDVLEGRVPPYLAELEAAPLDEVGEKVEAYVDALRGDCHSHSNWSDGGSSIEEMAVAAAELGHDYLVLTDHSPRLTVAHGLDAGRLAAQLEVVRRLNAQLAPFRILTGIEVDILEDGALDQEESLLAELDVVVASVHSKLSMDAAAMTERMIAAIESPLTDILGHCTGRKLVGRGRKPSSFDSARVFEACARTGTAVEINSRPERRDPPPDLLAEAVSAGCLFSIDTDAHAPGQLEWLYLGCQQAADASVPIERVVNTMDADRLIGWAAGKD